MGEIAEQPLPLPPHDDLGNSNHHTDSEGRFEFIGMVPGHTYNMDAIVRVSVKRLDTKVVRDLVLKPGEQRDLGDVVLKESRR